MLIILAGTVQSIFCNKHCQRIIYFSLQTNLFQIKIEWNTTKMVGQVPKSLIHQILTRMYQMQLKNSWQHQQTTKSTRTKPETYRTTTTSASYRIGKITLFHLKLLKWISKGTVEFVNASSDPRNRGKYIELNHIWVHLIWV